MGVDLGTHPKVVRIASALGTERWHIVAALYQVASWAQVHGDFGCVRSNPVLVDAVVGIPGIAERLLAVDWMRATSNGVLVRGFCKFGAGRKGLGKAVRFDVLAAGACSICGSEDRLEIDHIVPVSQGGSSARGNLQALCQSCNRKKGAR